jgi:iron complex outermembrane recepter protein
METLRRCRRSKGDRPIFVDAKIRTVPRTAVMRFCLAAATAVLLSAVGRFAVADSAADPNSTAAAPKTKQARVDEKGLDDLLNMAEKDIGKLSEVPVQGSSSAASATPSSGASSPTDTLSSSQSDFSKATSTGDLLKQIPNVSGRRLSGINIDPRVRGYNSAQLNASANGMTQRRSIQDIDSLLSQIDPGVIQEITVIDGPYTSLYGPGFAFITTDLFAPKRYDRPEMHSSTYFTYGSNGQVLYGRENVWGGGQTWGVYCTYGVRTGNDYRSGGIPGDLVPSSFEKWDTMLTMSLDLSSYARIEFDLLHTEMNNVLLPGIVYDLDNSVNSQYNLRYIIQEDRAGPKQLMLQSWHQETLFHGDASRASKQESFYQKFIADTPVNEGYDRPVNTLGSGYSVSTGVRCLRTFGEADGPQLTLGADWRRFEQRYLERDINAKGYDIYDGDLFGIPESRTDDVGVLSDVQLPFSDDLSLTLGGRVDYATTWLNVDDPITTVQPYYPGTDKPEYTLGMAYTTVKRKLNDHDTLNVGTGFAMRAPDLAELYSDQPFVPICRFGNSFSDGFSSLKPERNWEFDLGVVSERGRVRYGARGFYATIWDYIVAIPCGTSAPATSTHYLDRDFEGFSPSLRRDVGPSRNGDTCQAEYEIYNVGLATMAGGDLFGEYRIRKGFTVFGCVSYVHGENLQPVHVTLDAKGNRVVVPNGSAEPLPGIYPLNGRISLRVFEPDKDKWGTEFIVRLVNSQEEVATSLAELPSPAFSVFDLRGYYRVRENLRVSLTLENLLNANYYEPGSLVIIGSNGVPTFIREPGFSAILGIDGKF